MLSAEALAVIGGASSMGSLLTGWLGGDIEAHTLLGLLYILRSIMIAAYFVLPPTPTSTLFVRCGDGRAVVARLGAAHRRSGRRHLWHPLSGDLARPVLRRAPGGVVAWSLGRRIDLRPLRLYDRAWQIGTLIGFAAGIVQILAGGPTRPRDRMIVPAVATTKSWNLGYPAR